MTELTDVAAIAADDQLIGRLATGHPAGALDDPAAAALADWRDQQHRGTRPIAAGDVVVVPASSTPHHPVTVADVFRGSQGWAALVTWTEGGQLRGTVQPLGALTHAD